MSTTVQITQPAAESLARWRALSDKQKREARLAVVIDRVAASMAMENEPVSEAWIQQAKQTRV
ncbi:hypothetical protein NF556_13780 [Ornithinimicrobium faecis]|uniref:Addiction module antitoxin RelB n=1 Tax=Ornithinimicrobium faecis TaxID=2934158 RepID=A0ABY4YQ10_9MICO|nr:hypothetical protein [Ornithinimicrobium sp. HY1793]USQ78692.1 hypothetical protein NF556_13780 [Ornithinimicrobium sp. HY1793]